MAKPVPKKSETEMADILAYADKCGDRAASERANISTRTLRRYRESMRTGRRPELAAAVHGKKVAAAKRIKSLLSETYEAALRRLQAVLPKAEVREVIGAVKICGELAIAEKVLLDDEQPGGHSEGESPSAPQGPADQDEASARVH